MATLLAMIVQLWANVKRLDIGQMTITGPNPQPNPCHLKLPVFKGKRSIYNFLDQYEAYAIVQSLM